MLDVSPVSLLKLFFDSIKCNVMDFKPCFNFRAIVPVFSFQDAMPWMIHHQRNPELLAKASRRDLKKKAGSEERRNHHDEFRSIQILHNFSKLCSTGMRTLCLTLPWCQFDPDPAIRYSGQGMAPSDGIANVLPERSREIFRNFVAFRGFTHL